MDFKGITVYCASSDDIPQIYKDTAYALGRQIALAGLPVINGAGRMGLMRAVSDGALDAGGSAIGVIPQFMVVAGRNYPRLSKTIITPDMATRKRELAAHSIGVVALPGGVGTLEEIAEMMTARKLGLYDGAVVILNINGYYDSLLEWLRIARAEGFSYGPDSFSVAHTPEEAINLILNNR